LVKVFLLRPLLAAVLLTACFVLCIGLIRAQPYDESALRAFLAAPEGCPRPCFIGIRPGTTTVEEALSILDSHSWIAGVTRYEATDGRGVTALTATWSSVQSAFVDDSEELWLGVDGNIVQAIFIPTRVPLAHIWLLYGPPEHGSVIENAIPETSLPSAGYSAVYFEQDMVFMSSAFCPVESVWALSMHWVLWNGLSAANTPQSHDLPTRVHQVCRDARSNP
jgi:hypothetical protein